MKNKQFYSHLVETTDLTLEIANLEVDSKERVHLLSLMEANIHTVVVSEALSGLSAEDKKTFLKNLAQDNHKKTLQHLSLKASDIEKRLKKIIDKVTKELLEDVKDAQKIKTK
jgi:glutamine amidotransferase-like uncharacterized protein